MILVIAFACALVLMYLQRLVYNKYWNKNLDVNIRYKTLDCVAGEENELIEVITNNKWLPIPILHVKFDTPTSFHFQNEDNSSVTDLYYRDDIFTIMGHQSITRTLKFTCESRGCFYMNDTSITSSDLFLEGINTDKRKNSAIIHVYPRKVNVDFFDTPFNTITGSYVTNKTLIEDPFEFRGIRSYQPFDNIKNINWKSSAKNNELKVNTFFMTSSHDIMVLLNLDNNIYSKDYRLTERIISLASSLCEKFVTSGIPVGLITNGRDKFTKEQILCQSGGGLSHMVAIDTCLARLNINDEYYDFLTIMKNTMKNEGDSTYYIIISNNRSDELLHFYGQTKERELLSYFIVPELKQYEVRLDYPDMLKWDIDY